MLRCRPPRLMLLVLWAFSLAISGVMGAEKKKSSDAAAASPAPAPASQRLGTAEGWTANVVGGAPVTTFVIFPETSLTLPPSLFGNNSIIDVIVTNPTAADVNVGSTLVVQSADGTVWLQQDTSADQTIAPGVTASIDFNANGDIRTSFINVYQYSGGVLKVRGVLHPGAKK